MTAEHASATAAVVDTPPPASPLAPSRHATRKRALLGLVVLVALAALGAGAYWWWVGRWQVSTSDAYVGGNLVQVTALTSGTVKAVLATETQIVSLGQPLVELDGADAQAALAASEAALAKAVRAVRGQFAASAQASAGMRQRNADLSGAQASAEAAHALLLRAQSDLARQIPLAQRGFVSDQALVAARDAVAVAQANYQAALAAANAARAGIGGAREQMVAAQAQVERTTVANHPDVLAAAAAVRQAFLNAARSRIVAPVAGTLGKRTVQLGQHVSAGSPLMTVVPLTEVWVDANFKETELAQLRIGQPVSLTADFYGDSVKYAGTVAGLSPVTGSAQSLLPAQNASGNWIKIVQRLPVRIALDRSELAAHPLRVGLSMNLVVDLHAANGAALSPLAPAAETTPIFDGQVAQAQARIDQIIADNIERAR
ncbi:MAG: HlyD family efflux transporter periplasmic adaptor subunit [Sulfuricella sp.]